MNNIKPFNINCEPSPSVPAETLIQNGWHTYLLFFAISKEVNEEGYFDDLGVAVLECKKCSMTKFGYPNDEGLPEHPLYQEGLENTETDIVQVLNSEWLQEIETQMENSSKRIWGGRGMKSKIEKTFTKKHFIITLKELTFECISEDIKVVNFASSFDTAIKFVNENMEES